jgi:hypothetical protein
LPVEVESLRDQRRTSSITIGPDTVEVCEPDCRNDVLLDLGIPASGGWAYPPRGNANVTVAWNGKDYAVSWRRVRMNDHPCELCADEWRYRIPALVADSRARSERQRFVAPGFGAPFKPQTPRQAVSVVPGRGSSHSILTAEQPSVAV